MAREIARGDVWLHAFRDPDKRRPVLVLSRQDAIDLIRTVMVAPITSTRYGVPSEVPIGVEHGMKGPCAINLDHIQTVRQDDLRRYVTTLDRDAMAAVCRALAIAAGCG